MGELRCQFYQLISLCAGGDATLSSPAVSATETHRAKLIIDGRRASDTHESPLPLSLTVALSTN